MIANPTPSDEKRTETNWAVTYDTDPIEIRDPVAETLAVLEPGDPFVITYKDVITAAGHSCPTAAGAYRITRAGLDALYPNAVPVRSEINVLAGGPRNDATYGVMGRLVSFITGAAEDDGFGGLAGGYGNRRDLLSYDAFDLDTPSPTFRFRRIDTNDIVEVTFHVEDAPDGGPEIGLLQKLVEGSASQDQREAFASAWHGRVQAILSKESLVTVRWIGAE